MQFCVKNPRQKQKQTNHLSLEAYSDPAKRLRWNFSKKFLTAYSRRLFSQKAPSQMFDRVLNMLLYFLGIANFKLKEFFWVMTLSILKRSIRKCKESPIFLKNPNLKGRAFFISLLEPLLKFILNKIIHDSSSYHKRLGIWNVQKSRIEE